MHYTEARWSGKWPNFTPKEIACKCCGEIVVDEASMDALQRLRDMWGEPSSSTAVTAASGTTRKWAGSRIRSI